MAVTKGARSLFLQRLSRMRTRDSGLGSLLCGPKTTADKRLPLSMTMITKEGVEEKLESKSPG